MKSHSNSSPWSGHLALELLRAVLPDDPDARLGERGQRLGGEVLDGGEHLHGAPAVERLHARAAACDVDLGADALEVRAHPRRVEAGDQLSHATPA